MREAQSKFKMFEAVPSSSSLGALDSMNISMTPSVDDPEVAKFLPLLQDYLKSENNATSTSKA